MLPEILNIQVSDEILQQKPANYSSYAAHLEEVEQRKERIAKEQQEKKENRKKKRGADRSHNFKMDVSQETDTSNTTQDLSGSGINVSTHSEDMDHQTSKNSHVT